MSSIGQDDEARYGRLCLFVLNICPYTLRRVIDKCYTTEGCPCLEDFLDGHKHDLFHLAFRICCCRSCVNTSQPMNRSQWDLLFHTRTSTVVPHPRRGDCPCQYKAIPGILTDVMDVNLCCLILRNLCPGVSAADVDVIRKTRNQLVHASNAKLDEPSYSATWGNVKRAVLSLAAGVSHQVETNTRTMLEELKHRIMNTADLKILRDLIIDQTQLDNLKEDVGELKLTISSIEQKLATLTTMRSDIATLQRNAENTSSEITALQTVTTDITERVTVLKTSTTNASSVVGTTQGAIHHWIKTDEAFYETSSFHASFEMVESKGHVTIIGAPGDGKSAIGNHIALRYHKTGYRLYQVHSVDDIIKNYQPDVQQVFVADDPIGVHVIDDEKLMNWTVYNESLKGYLEKGKTKVILTVRKNILNCRKKAVSKTLLGENQIDLTDPKYTTSEEKRGVLLKQAKAYHRELEEEDISHFLEPTYYPGFPLLCHFIVTGLENISDFKPNQKPTEVIRHQIEELAESENGWSNYCVLVITAMHDGKFDPEELDCLVGAGEVEGRSKVRNIIEICGLQCNPKCIKILRQSFDTLLGVYLVKSEDGVEFLHDRIYSAVAHHFGTEHLQFMLSSCSSSFVREMVRSEDASIGGDWSNEDETNLIVTVKRKKYKEFSKRLLTDLYNGYVVDVFLNPSLSDERFQSKLTERLLKLSRENLERVLSRKPHSKFEEESKRQGKNSLDFGILSCTPFHWICKLGLTNMFDTIMNRINDSKTFLGNLSKEGHTDPLHFAAGFGHLDIVKRLVKLGVDVNAQSKLKTDDVDATSVGEYYSRFTPIFYAARQDHLDVVQFLLKSGANPDMVREHGASPMLLAADRGNHRIVGALLDHNADPNICCSHGTSPLFIASQEGHIETVRILIQRGGKVNHQKPGSGQYPLYITVKKGHFNVAKLLLENGAKPNLCDKDGNTSLHMAMKGRDADLVQILLDHGADPDLKNKEDITPKSLALLDEDLKSLFTS